MSTGHPRGGVFSRLYALKTARFRELVRREIYSALYYGCAVWLFSRVFPVITGEPLTGVLVVVTAVLTAIACTLLVSGTDVYVMDEYFAEEEESDRATGGGVND
jgi:hypothetical protein